MLANKTIVLGITGGIAAYKAADIASKLTQAGARVEVVMTESATKFITPLTLRNITGRPVVTDTAHLAAQEVEVLRRGGGVDDLDVVLGGRASGTARCAPSSARGPGPRSRAAAAAPAPFCWPHLSSAATMYWSMMIWAPLTKSPNCASHITSASRLACGVAVLEAERGVLRQQRVVAPRTGAVGRRASSSGIARSPVSKSISAAWRWLKVPRRESWPARRTGVPSSSSEPNASASAVAQSTSPLGVHRGAGLELAASLGWTVKPSGYVGQRWRRSGRASRRSTPVGDVGQHAQRRGGLGARDAPRCGPASGSRRARPAAWRWKSASALLGLVDGDVAAPHQRLDVAACARCGARRSRLYMSGWV